MSLSNTSRDKRACSPEVVGSPLGTRCSDVSEVLQAASFSKICHLSSDVSGEGAVSDHKSLGQVELHGHNLSGIV